jgi:glutamate-1-semialdehyde aminotransferase
VITLAKSMGGGVSVAAIGGTEQTMAHVADGGYEMVGTFNGNPLAMAATRAMLTEVGDAGGVPEHRAPSASAPPPASKTP